MSSSAVRVHRPHDHPACGDHPHASTTGGTMRTDHETLSLSITHGILLATLDRPEAMNSFTVTMADELEATFR